MDKVNPAEKLDLFDEHWAPKIVAELNDYHLKLVKAQGEFVPHVHETTDEFFMVLAGRLTIHTAVGDFALDPGEFLVVPKGMRHHPSADVETHILLIEPAGTENTGDDGGGRTTPAERI
jgi:mannose-6-phosphate isomerase-like protein (cupin superfamily)